MIFAHGDNVRACCFPALSLAPVSCCRLRLVSLFTFRLSVVILIN